LKIAFNVLKLAIFSRRVNGAIDGILDNYIWCFPRFFINLASERNSKIGDL